MNDLVHIFERLGLSQYLANFIEEGFDSWDTVLYITESDLDALNVKLGHRRKLQREIALARGISFEQLLAQSANVLAPPSASNAERGRGSGGRPPEGPIPLAGPAKRKYRRHPKTDENAPDRPPSAYVIFSNQIREELKPQKLSFTEIAKTVGERWQALAPEDKEPFEAKANGAKDIYSREMIKYKKTAHYREYMQYLADFRAKNSGPAGEGKRPRVDKERGSVSSESTSPSLQMIRTPLTLPGIGSPVSTVFESPSSMHTTLFRPPPLPSGPSASSTESASPISTMPPPGPLSMATASPPGSRPHHQPFPRIVPLEPHHQQGHPPALLTEPHSLSHGNLRRSDGTPTAPFLRHDTSMSSLSSNLSGPSTMASAGSPAAFSPTTPVEEQHRFAPRGPGPVLPPLTPAGHFHPPPQSISQYHSAVPMKRLSLEDDDEAYHRIQRPRSNPSDAGSPRSPNHVHRMSTSSDRPAPLAAGQPERSKLDPLSVLALAGNMMDRRPPGRDRPP